MKAGGQEEWSLMSTRISFQIGPKLVGRSRERVKVRPRPAGPPAEGQPGCGNLKRVL